MKDAVSPKPNISIVGAGMGGTLMAIFLSRQGFSVDLYEERSDVRKIEPNSDRSINQSLSLRGVSIFEELGLWKQLRPKTLVERGRVFHISDGNKIFSPYGRADHEVHYTFNRNALNGFLLDQAESLPGVRVFFETRFVDFDSQSRVATFVDRHKNKKFQKKIDILIGADGINSAVRGWIPEGKISYQREKLDWGYKNFYVPKELGKALRDDVFNMWPRENCALFAIANSSGSFVCTLMLPMQGPVSLESIRTEEDIRQFFQANFSEVLPLLLNLGEEFVNNKTGKFECVYASLWHFEDKVVMLGDAVHAFMPFYGQGVSATAEDCKSLASCIKKYYPDWKKAFVEYEKERKVNTDTITNLSKERFYALKDGYRSQYFRSKEKAELVLSRLFPGFWIPLYSLVSHTTIPYAGALKRYRRQQAIAKYLGIFAVAYLADLCVLRMSSLRFDLLEFEKTGVEG